MKKFIGLLILFLSIKVSGQQDSLKLAERYWEDQLYIGITYNTLNRQLKDAKNNGFSYGVSLGYIKDIPFNKKGNWAVGIGLGYEYDSFSHSLQVVDNSGELKIPEELVTSNKIRLHSLEMPIQLRWRNSNSVVYSFWRVYAGIRLGYNFNNIFKYSLNNQNYSFVNIPTYNKFQTGLELSVGYSAFNFYVYYGLTPIYKGVLVNNKKVDTQIVKFGLIFYLL